MPAVDDRFDDLILELGVPAAREALDDVVKSGVDAERFDGRAVMLKAGLTAIHGDGAYRRLVIDEFVEHLTIANNDVLVVHVGADDVDDDEAMNAWMSIAHNLASRFRAQGVDTTVILASQTGGIDNIPEEMMVTKGWVRAARLRKVADGDWSSRVDEAVASGEAQAVANLFWEFYNRVEDFASGVAVEEQLTTEDELRSAARFYFGGVTSALQVVTFLVNADKDDFLQWQAKAAGGVIEGFEKGRNQYRHLVDPEWNPDPADDDEDDDEEDTDG